MELNKHFVPEFKELVNKGDYWPKKLEERMKQVEELELQIADKNLNKPEKNSELNIAELENKHEPEA